VKRKFKKDEKRKQDEAATMINEHELIPLINQKVLTMRRLIINTMAMLTICAGALFMGAPEARSAADIEICHNDDMIVIADECACIDDVCACTLPCTVIT
jgi:hypothetical protein